MVLYLQNKTKKAKDYSLLLICGMIYLIDYCFIMLDAMSNIVESSKDTIPPSGPCSK